MIFESFGKTPSGDRLKRIKRSPNYRHGSFQNLEPTSMMAKGISYVTLMRRYLGKGIDRAPKQRLPSVKTDLRALTLKKPAIVWFGHSSYLIRINDKNILIDPVFSERASPFQSLGMKAYPGSMAYTSEDMPEIDMMIITHDHYDHLDYSSIIKLKGRTKLFCTALGVGSHLEHWGIERTKIIEFDWWDAHTVLPGIELIAAPARHFSGRGLVRNKTLWCSFILKTQEHRIFIGGDSGYDSSFNTIGEKYGPFDIVMLEDGQYDLMWPFIHMMPEEVVQASLDLKAKVLMPVHWGKFTLALHPWYEPVKRLLKRARELNAVIVNPEIGEKVELGVSSDSSSQWWEGID